MAAVGDVEVKVGDVEVKVGEGPRHPLFQGYIVQPLLAWPRRQGYFLENGRRPKSLASGE